MRITAKDIQGLLRGILQGILIFIMLSIFLAGVDHVIHHFSSTTDHQDTNTPSNIYINQAYVNTPPINVTWYELMRTPDKYEGKVVVLTGQVFQVEKVWGDEYVALIFTKREPYVGYYDNIVWINYNEKKTTRILENDIIKVKGVFKGLKEYTTVLGATNTVPEVDAIEIEIIVPAEKNS